MSLSTENLPRLLYVGDVPVESTVGGAALLYRLLVDYPKDRLRIIQSSLSPRLREAQIPDVRYETFHGGYPRLLRTRWKAAYSKLLFRGAAGRGRRLARRWGRDSWKPQAILTVAHGFGWISAAELAERLNLPLRLIVHDDVLSVTAVPSELKSECERRFGQVWRQASSRLCISPFMAERYEAQFGGTGDVLFPSRAPGAPEFNEPPAGIASHSTNLNVVFAGSAYADSSIRFLADFAEILGRRGHRLTLFSNIAPETANRFGLNSPHVSLRPIVPFLDLIHELRENADVLFVQMSYDPEFRSNTEILFPSKLADYTAVGLPLLISGPSYSSAVRWARDHAPVAEICERPEDLSASVQRLENPEYRGLLATAAIAVGGECFSYQRIIADFRAHLCNGKQ